MTRSVWRELWRPRMEPTGRRVVVRHRGETIASSTRCWRVSQLPHAPVHYLPRSDVCGTLAPSAKRTYCPYKGVASYWHLRVGGAVVRDAAWSYEDPRPGYAELRGAVAFAPSAVDGYTVAGVRVAGNRLRRLREPWRRLIERAGRRTGPE